MAEIIIEIEKKWENVTPNGISCTKEEAEGRANWLSYVRDKDAGTYSLSVRDNVHQKRDYVEHYRIQMDRGNGFIINKQSVFPMLLWRVPHYQSIWNCNTPVAVKTLKEGTSADLLAEANFMKRVGHERLLQPYAVCSDREPIYKLTSNGSLLDYLKDGTGKDTKLTTHVDMGAHITIAKNSNEKEWDNVPPDDGGMVKERPIEAANENTTLLCPLKKEEELKETEKHAASGEQNTSLPPASNNKTCSNKYPVMKHIYKWMLLIYLLFGTTTTVSAKVQRRDFRKIIIDKNETQIATDPILRPVDYSVYSVFATDGNDDREGFECTPGFVSTNQSCPIVVGDTSKAECKGLRISVNASYLVVVGSELTHDRTTYCIYQQVPRSYILYHLEVCKKHEQDNVQQEFPRNINIAPNSTVDATDLVPIPAPKTNHYKVACFILVFILVIAIAIVIKKKFPCIRAWWKKIWMERVPTTDPDQGQNTTVLHDLDRTIDSVA